MLGCWSSSSFLIPSTSILSFVAKLRKAHNGCDGALDSDACCATSATMPEMSGTLPRTVFCVKHVVLVWRTAASRWSQGSSVGGLRRYGVAAGAAST